LLKVVYYTAMYDVYVYDVRVCVGASWGLSVADSQILASYERLHEM
jgi:hypothetical protein